MKYFNGHSDLFTAMHYKYLEGESKIFTNNYYDDFVKGDVGSSIFVLWTDEAHQNDYRNLINGERKTVKKVFDDNREAISQVLTLADLDKTDDKVHVLLGVEGLAHIGEDIDLIDEYYEVDGLRHARLTWNEKNPLAKRPRFSGGLSKLAIKALHKLQDLGIIVDVSHLNDDGFWDIMKYTNGPIMASHSNARTLASHKRNLTDKMMKALKENSGMMGLNAACDFISDDPQKQDLEHLVIMLEHIVDIMGVDQVFFGFDFMEMLPVIAQGTMRALEGKTSTPKDFIGEADIPNLIKKMREHGFSE
ncbi:membrane dipeptidase [uncultured Peptoniphilus sp.]|uniref:dipeptidase n=1 Tax=uncultured Peptoniphilus sp. TaxID=254354 RepID=UPI002803FA2B|nr:membrane dipeptidase [uncultured Peptoniphilus sp.]